MTMAYRALKSCIVLFALVLAVQSAGLGDGSRLAPGDVIMLNVDGEKEFSRQFQVNRDGTITMPMNIQPVKIEGLNTSDAAGVVTKALSDVLVNPQVTLGFVDRAKMQVFVVGQVKKAGLVEIGYGDRVLQALAQAGYDDTSDLARVSVRRGDQSMSLDLTKYLSANDLSVNVELQSGDTVVVPQANSIGTVMVLGQVNKVGAVPLKQGMTFRELMGFVGGVTVEADKEKVTIKRTGTAEPIRVNYERAMDLDPAADLVLQPSDTIYVPQLETSFFTVMGGVNRPGQFPLKGRLTLSEAIGTAGGPTPNVGDTRKVQIVRAGTGAERGETLNVDLKKLNSKGDAEPLVKRGDVINVAVHKQRSSVWDILRNLSPLGWLFRL